MSSPIETNKIAHGTDGEINHQIHVAGMNFIDGIAPVIYSTPMRIEDGHIEGRVT
jgi:hypothetical protein